MANDKVKIAYAIMPVEITDEQGNKTIVYKKFHPVTTGNAVVVGGKTLTKRLADIYNKDEVNTAIQNATKIINDELMGVNSLVDSILND